MHAYFGREQNLMESLSPITPEAGGCVRSPLFSQLYGQMHAAADAHKTSLGPSRQLGGPLLCPFPA